MSALLYINLFCAGNAFAVATACCILGWRRLAVFNAGAFALNVAVAVVVVALT